MKRLLTVCFAMLITVSIMLTGCGTTIVERELSCYRGEEEKPDGSILYNTALFYDNEVQQGFPDPQVLDDTARSGYYYLYGTSSGFFTMRSKNLTEWENVGPVFNQSQTKEVERCTSAHMWAPEVVYENGTYYLFFSATPEADDSIDEAAAGVAGVGLYNIYVATSSKPDGPFTMVNFKDENLPEKTRHDFNTETNVEITEEQALSGEYAYVKEDSGYYKAAFPHYFAKYCLFSPDELSKVLQRRGVTAGSSEKPNALYWGCIDPHPFVDPRNGDKYLYFKVEPATFSFNLIMYVKMTDWLTPDWTHSDYLIMNGYYTLADWENDENKGVSYEQTVVNEGPCMLYHEDANGTGKFYLTYSVNDATSSNYQVCTAIADEPDGPFRKLTEEEGGRLLTSITTESMTVSGTGHHSFMTIGDQLFIIYHRHKDYSAGGTDRYTAADEVKWITVKDKDGADLDVPYVNGPTDSIQPQPAAFSGYKNIAGEANITASGAQNLDAVTDGLLSIHKTANETFMSYIPETIIASTTTFTFEFAEARNARAVMIYNSAFEDFIFRNVSRIEFLLADGSTRVVRDVTFDIKHNGETGGADGNSLLLVKSGAAAFIEFYDINVKSVKVTVDVPEGQESVGISEIRILGK